MMARSPFGSGRPGKTFPGHRYEAHVHSAHWRIDIDLFDGKKNSAMLMKHVEDPSSLSAEDVKEPFNGGLEGGVDWDPKEFTMIRVQCDKQNARGELIGYDLMPLRYGTPRHHEEFTRHDLWVTRSHPDRPMEFIYREPAEHHQRRRSGGRDRYRALDQLGRPSRAAARGWQAEFGPAALAGGRCLGRLGARHVERL